MYLIDGTVASPDDDGFPELLADAHERRTRPLCMCRVPGVEMYIARVFDTCIVKRMPFTGYLHAEDCASHDLPPNPDRIEQGRRAAIHEDPDSGLTTLRLGFRMSMSDRPGGAARANDAARPGSAASEPGKLGLRDLLQYLWCEAELNRWHPGFKGRRNWATVRKQLLLAAGNKVARGRPIVDSLYIPEPFSVDQRDAINARRAREFERLRQADPHRESLILVISELREIAPARYGFKAVLKQVPDQPFVVEESLHRKLGERFDSELSLWAASDAVRMMLIATARISGSGLPVIEELSLMPVSIDWLPVAHLNELRSLAADVEAGRRFVARFSSSRRLNLRLRSKRQAQSRLRLDSELGTDSCSAAVAVV